MYSYKKKKNYISTNKLHLLIRNACTVHHGNQYRYIILVFTKG